eukprot:GHVU01031648.1.p1 GENE.GHVU01031648.1~~GHVU01031648.1.p1  ORF type:complete len:112 (+),score=5.84 GHVU01031648.1:576-911(+)
MGERERQKGTYAITNKSKQIKDKSVKLGDHELVIVHSTIDRQQSSQTSAKSGRRTNASLLGSEHMLVMASAPCSYAPKARYENFGYTRNTRYPRVSGPEAGNPVPCAELST